MSRRTRKLLCSRICGGSIVFLFALLCKIWKTPPMDVKYIVIILVALLMIYLLLRMYVL